MALLHRTGGLIASRCVTLHQIKLKSIKGEANNVNPETVETFRAGIATTLPQRYAPEDIFNCDEAGLFRCTYRWNGKSWMRSDLFTQWLIKWNRKFWTMHPVIPTLHSAH
ncbi:unnamed protein product [Meganyctiphanes norvegica]|uniref:Transposase n=1 Tax=Meganyctiphanes norvegica TaxID=48144 RepID=A0AAV2SY40_MEGNR